MHVRELIEREGRTPDDPAPHVPWHDGDFSARMLREHLDQSHDRASRREAVIAQHVDWIHRRVLDGCVSRVLDLGCGPGLYTARLAALGHRCVGVDVAPAAIAFAKHVASDAANGAAYVHGDLRHAALGGPWDATLMLYGIANQFAPDALRAILSRVAAASAPGARLVLETLSIAAIERIGREPPTWRRFATSVFGDAPHLVLRESAWRPAERVAVERYDVIGADGGVGAWRHEIHAHSPPQLESLLRDEGFTTLETYPALGAASDDAFAVLVAHRR